MTRPMHQDAAAAAVLRRTMVLLLLLLMFSLSSFPSVTADCPDKCLCYKKHNVDCSEKELNRIPDRISPATEILDLTHNEIRDIEPNSFTNLTELKDLLLLDNKISNLKIGAFANLSKLQILTLSHNKIENIETGVFNNLTSLEYLSLNHNKIHKLDLEMFKGLTKLDYLFLHYNKIRNIPPGIFDSLTSFSRLNIDINWLDCECDMLLFANGLKKNYHQRDFFFRYQTYCYFSVGLIEQMIVMQENIYKFSMNCYTASPDLIVVTENQKKLDREPLKLLCEEVLDPEPFKWAEDKFNLDLGQEYMFFQNNMLLISKVEKTDGDQYKCVGSDFDGQKYFEAFFSLNDGDIKFKLFKSKKHKNNRF